MKLHKSHEFEQGLVNGLVSIDVAASLIVSGASLSVAGRHKALASLPQGNWIGGTIPYFMTDDGGIVVGDDLVFVTDFSVFPSASVEIYDADHLDQITADAPDNGFSLAILPFDSECQRRFAAEASSYPNAFLNPTVGWIAGFDLNEAGGYAAVFDGTTGEMHRDCAVVLHVGLPMEQFATIEILNIFEPDHGDVIHFEEISSTPEYCSVNGQRVGFASYIRARDMQAGLLPLVGDFAGAALNASIRAIEGDKVTLYAPVYPGVDYHFAQPLGDYAATFETRLSAWEGAGTVWSCNCILNFLFGNLEGKSIGSSAGPVTFGEIAYQLLNQTLVRLRIVDQAG